MDLKDLTYTINGAIYEVNRELGSGFLEKVYESALLIELQERGLKAERQVPISVNYKGNIVGEYLADMIVEGKVILELKSVVDLEKIHEAQIINYLKATGLQVGLLVNFTYPKAQIKRFFNSTDDSSKV
jgi:GxxExxY protein